MFLRSIKRHEDGKLHLCWTLVESVRDLRHVFRRQAPYLGELSDSQRAEWQRTIKAFDEKGVPASSSPSRPPVRTRRMAAGRA